MTVVPKKTMDEQPLMEENGEGDEFPVLELDELDAREQPVFLHPRNGVFMPRYMRRNKQGGWKVLCNFPEEVPRDLNPEESLGFKDTVTVSFPSLPEGLPIHAFATLRPVSVPFDFEAGTDATVKAQLLEARVQAQKPKREKGKGKALKRHSILRGSGDDAAAASAATDVAGPRKDSPANFGDLVRGDLAEATAAPDRDPSTFAASFSFRCARGWHYGWRSDRAKHKMMHCFTAATFAEVEPGTLRCVSVVDSQPFRVISERRAQKGAGSARPPVSPMDAGAIERLGEVAVWDGSSELKPGGGVVGRPERVQLSHKRSTDESTFSTQDWSCEEASLDGSSAASRKRRHLCARDEAADGALAPRLPRRQSALDCAEMLTEFVERPSRLLLRRRSSSEVASLCGTGGASGCALEEVMAFLQMLSTPPDLSDRTGAEAV